MRLTRWLGPTILVVGLATLVLSVERGEASLYLVVFVPVVAGSGPLAFLGILLVFLGFFLTFFLWPARTETGPAGQATDTVLGEGAPPARRWGGIVFLGPIPIVFGSDSQVTRTMLWVGIILFFALLALTLILLFG